MQQQMQHSNLCRCSSLIGRVRCCKTVLSTTTWSCTCKTSRLAVRFLCLTSLQIGPGPQDVASLRSATGSQESCPQKPLPDMFFNNGIVIVGYASVAVLAGAVGLASTTFEEDFARCWRPAGHLQVCEAACPSRSGPTGFAYGRLVANLNVNTRPFWRMLHRESEEPCVGTQMGPAPLVGFMNTLVSERLMHRMDQPCL